ncbi:DUF4198 domain-containing protein [Asticcacaulis sp. W401b]|uniref:DUF4198 domain-containing protein n=1 Tax=Asticcacaulis sp. W401b TaxID=3388666 RepID=UPI00397114AC
MAQKRPIFSRLTALILSSGLAFSATPTLAHDFWLQPERFKVAAGQSTPVTLQVGHGGDRQKSLIPVDRVVSFYDVTAKGRLDRRSELRLGDPDMDTRLAFRNPGLQILALETTGAYSELPAERFEAYLKEEGLTPALVQRVQTQRTDRPGRETYSRRAKALVQAGAYSPADDAVVVQPLGLTLEIVPEVNPYAPDYAGKLPLRVYYEGQPLPGATVMLNNLAFDGKPLARIVSDQDGRVVFEVPKTGTWQINVVWTKPLEADPKHDFETVFSSLTFGYQ